MSKSYRYAGVGSVFLIGLVWRISRERAKPTTEPHVAPNSGAASAVIAPRAVAGALSGSARSLDGSPIAGALVCANDAAVRALGSVSTRCVLSGAAGHYHIAGLSAGAYDMSVVAEGFLPAAAGKEREIVVLNGRETGAIDFALEHGGAPLRGLVVDATGGPIQAAKLDLSFGERALRNMSVETKEDGRFLAWLTPGRVVVRASAEGYAPSQAFHVAPSGDLVMRLAPASAIHGLVLAGTHRTPVAGVEVRAVCANCFNSAASPSGISGPRGEFTIGDLNAGSYSLSAEGEGVRGLARTRVDIGLAQTIDGIVVVVIPAPSVTGQVRLESGAPCTRGTVHLEPPSAAPTMFDPPSKIASAPIGSAIVPNLVASINETGAVHFRAATSGSYHVVVRCEDQVLVAGPTTIEVGQTNVDGLNWKVDRGLKLIVHVVDEVGRPLGGTNFFCTWPDRGGGTRDRIMFTTNPSGRYETASYLYPGTYEIAPYNGNQGDPTAVDLREGAGPVDVTLRLKGRGSIEVRVQSEQGAPIDAVRVSAVASEPTGSESGAAAGARTPPMKSGRSFGSLVAIPRGDGRFALGPLPSATYEVEVDDGVNAPNLRSVLVAADVVKETFVLERGYEIRGRVLDATGASLPDVWVSTTCRTSREGQPRMDNGGAALRLLRDARRALTDAQGAFVLGGLDRTAGSCIVRAEEPGGSMGIERGVTPGDDITITMQALAALSGSAHTLDGRAVESMTVTIRNDEYQQQRTETFTSSAGAWSMANITPGHVTISAWSAAGEVSNQTVEVLPAARLTGLVLELVPEAEVLRATR